MAIVNQRKSNIEQMKTKHITVLEKRADEITHTITRIKEAILEIKKTLATNDISLISTYKSRNNEFDKLPPKIKATLPTLSPPAIDRKKLNEMFGSLSSLSITTARSLLAEPRLVTTLNTGYESVYSASCLNEDKVWTRGNNEIMKLFDLRGNGKLLTSMPTKSGNSPSDISVTQSGDLIYTDSSDKTVNLVKNEQIQTLIKLLGWKPCYICTSSSDDILVSMISDDLKQCKVVRYSGSTEKQSIQVDDQGRPLYSPGSLKYINENRNLDVCVADNKAKAVVVVNQSGKLRYRYTGIPSDAKKGFDPVGIITDRQSHILTTDWDNNIIHI
jgi:hypothetical protein